ncbi:hypothetical protein QFC20_007456 [Naganishia adeliensis]|uniref:Uncharacterized protein n=1 Tax=Naganishia adeliensis TaxID=92952 RepID=A0ACC2UYS2_9TREE|nr:hypothetical protein QFC20_007456 [Naganishia adeliensis]
MGKDAPPPYSEHLTRTATQQSAPAYAIAPPLVNPDTLLPSTFRVGQYDVSPFVTVPEMILHLRLLAAFDALQQRVRVFCTRAEKDFEAWVKRLPEGTVRLEDEEVPALDVVMCWHAYMLNPRRWWEDCERDDRIGKGGTVGEVSVGAGWTRLPFPTSPETTTFSLACPQCITPNAVPWLKAPNQPHGYCQKEFQHPCVGCGLMITHDVLRANKVCEDIVGVVYGDVKFLPGLGLMPSTGNMTPLVGPRVSRAIAAVFKLAFDNAFPDKTRLQDKSGQTFTASALGQHVFHWSFAEFEKILDKALKSGVIARASPGVMFKRYRRQPSYRTNANFIGKMKGLGWLRSGRFEGEPFLLQKSAARYHAFLDLMRSMQGFLCPTLDIDLAWHTHQLQGEEYRVSTLQVTGPSFPRFVDHDDKVSEVRLGDAYDLTARAWMARYKVPYSQCGCHQGDLSSIDGGLSAAIPDKLKFWNKGESKSDQRRRAIEKVIQGMEQGEKDASHPSVHNLVSVETYMNKRKQNVRLNKISQLDQKAESLEGASGEKDLELKRALTKSPHHPDPFVQDVPTLSYLRSIQPPPDEKTQLDTKFSKAGTSSVLPYWGVGVGLGAGLVVGGAVAWGLTVEDPHCLHEQDAAKRGGCAAGATGGGGYCGTGGTGACEHWRKGCLQIRN